MGFLGKINPFNIKHGLVHTVATTPILNKVAPIAAAFIPGVGPAISAGLTAAEAYSTGAKPLRALEAGGLNYAGNYIGSSIGNSLFPQTIGSELGAGANTAATAANSIGPFSFGDTGSALGNFVGNTVANKSIGGALGGIAGNLATSGLTAQPQQQQPQIDPNSLLPAAFSPKNNPQLQLPGSLTGLSSLTPDQQTSNLATQGVYGGGLGPEEQQYFTGLVNNQLVDPSGKVGNTSSLSPIENSYLSQLGFGGYSNSNDLLGAISNWQKKQQPQATA